MNSDHETGLSVVPETPKPPGKGSLLVLLISFLAVLTGAIAVGIFELTRQSFSSRQTWNIVLVVVAVGLIAVIGSTMWFYYSSRDTLDRHRDQTLSDPAFNVKIAEALTGIAQILDDRRSGHTSNVAGLSALLSLGRASPEAAGACADVVASFIRQRKDCSDMSPEDLAANSSHSELELAISIWSQLARLGYGALRLDLSGLSLKGLQLQNLTLIGADLTGANLNGSDISGSDLRGADLTEADLSRIVAVGVGFQEATLVKANLTGSIFRDSDFSEALLTGARFDGADLRRARFARALLPDASLRGADLTEADLNNALMVGADLTDAIVTGANLSGAAISPEAEGSLSDIRVSNYNTHVVHDPDQLKTWTSGRGVAGGSDE